MMTPDIDSRIDRRLLVSYRIDPDRAAVLLPRPFRPQLVGGYAVGGVCFLRLASARPAGLPAVVGLTTENVAHRFAVEWDEAGGTRTGVYVPRRDTSSRLTAYLGRHVIPGAYHLARFRVAESPELVRIDVRSRDGAVALSAAAVPAASLDSELFAAVDEAVAFFRTGDLGYSPSAAGGLDGVRLTAGSWAARPAVLTRMTSSLFDDPARFPPGTCVLDSALLMTGIPARWTGSSRAAAPSAGPVAANPVRSA
jgi:uncharacterized protein YqjF (DUF2071 family)